MNKSAEMKRRAHAAKPKLLPQNKCPEIPDFKEPMLKFKTDLPSISIFLWLLQSREKESREKEKKNLQERNLKTENEEEARVESKRRRRSRLPRMKNKEKRK
jgi:hypothetical protein